MSTPTTFWRLAGITYMSYVSRATSSLRSSLKEPLKSKLSKDFNLSYNRSTWEEGVQGVKKQVDMLEKAAK
eukprot:CAMPEP_0118640794 /NCGR_PEP_ID=MMETSP0785-20121206/4939_1 /TAXON_ID=91992 /ORGANISM="Bolidomonas pacifica, Strain CCMP 1866" /LENGTH=70 /DNA_ID=CAMNT_0006532197 /DNA_START=41 /DNA_END=253 /DNA_ORIENTATION=+